MSVLLEEAFDPPAGPSSSSYQEISPVPSFQLRRAVGRIETEVLVQTFGDRVLVVVTQNGKMGVVTQASLPASIPLPAPPRSAPSPSRLAAYPPPPPALRLTPLLGTAPAYPSPEVYATYTAQIATLVFWTLDDCQVARRPVVVSLALDRGARAHRHDSEEEGQRAGEEGEEEMEMEVERVRFGGIMDMVAAWPGA